MLPLGVRQYTPPLGPVQNVPVPQAQPSESCNSVCGRAWLSLPNIAEQLFFDSGRATLKDTGKEVLKKVADAIKSYDDKAIRIVGHTDNVPISGNLQKVFPSNWELSAARATTVVRFLQDTGIPPERLVATGRAEYAPVAPNDSPEGRQKNRRIEITLIDKGLVQ